MEALLDMMEGGTGSDIKSRLSEARNTFRMLNNVWKSPQYSIKNKIKLYQRCVLSTLLYSSEFWRMTASNLSKLSTFHTRSLLRIFWPNIISNQQILAPDQLRERNKTTRTALHWTPEECRKRGRPKETWCRTVERELKALKQTRDNIQRFAQNRQEWRSFVAALYTSMHKGQ